MQIVYNKYTKKNYAKKVLYMKRYIY